MTKKIAVIFEGIDCSGKSLHVDGLHADLNKMNRIDLYPVVLRPMSGPDRSWIRKELLSSGSNWSREMKSSIFTFDRYKMIKEELQSSKTSNVYIIDRWIASTMAYNGLSEDMFKPNELLKDFTVIQVYLSVDEDILLKRLNAKPNKDEHESDIKYLSKVLRDYPHAVYKVNSTLKSQVNMTLESNTYDDVSKNIDIIKNIILSLT